jgi:hypothetical protein
MCPAVSAARALRVLLLVLSLALVIPQHWESRVQVTLGSRPCCSVLALALLLIEACLRAVARVRESRRESRCTIATCIAKARCAM